MTDRRRLAASFRTNRINDSDNADYPRQFRLSFAVGVRGRLT
jgi:hypothetical protein